MTNYLTSDCWMFFILSCYDPEHTTCWKSCVTNSIDQQSTHYALVFVGLWFAEGLYTKPEIYDTASYDVIYQQHMNKSLKFVVALVHAFALLVGYSD